MLKQEDEKTKKWFNSRKVNWVEKKIVEPRPKPNSSLINDGIVMIKKKKGTWKCVIKREPKRSKITKTAEK